MPVKDVEQQPREHTPVRSDSLITSKYSSTALRASLADGKIDKRKEIHCVFCGMNNHKTGRCRKQLSVQEKLGKAFSSGPCFNCLVSTDHYAHECVKPKCSIEECGRAHHRFLHLPTNPSRESGKVPGNAFLSSNS